MRNASRTRFPAAIRSLAENPPDLGALSRGRAVSLGGDEIDQSAAWLPPGTATAVCLAVESEAGPIGTLWAYDRRRREPSDREIHVLESISVQIATLLKRVVLLRESEAQHRLQRDLAIGLAVPVVRYRDVACRRLGNRGGRPLDQPLRDRRRFVRIDLRGGRAAPSSRSATRRGTASRRRS